MSDLIRPTKSCRVEPKPRSCRIEKSDNSERQCDIKDSCPRSTLQPMRHLVSILGCAALVQTKDLRPLCSSKSLPTSLMRVKTSTRNQARGSRNQCVLLKSARRTGKGGPVSRPTSKRVSGKSSEKLRRRIYCPGSTKRSFLACSSAPSECPTFTSSCSAPFGSIKITLHGIHLPLDMLLYSSF